MRPVTQEDIARSLNVTRITVSKALRDHPDISPAMKKRVNEKAAELGYSPNLIARQLTTRTTETIGVMVPDLENSFFSHVVDSIIDTAANRNYQVLLAVSRERKELEEKNLLNLIGKRVDGLLVCLSQETHTAEILEPVRRVGIPLVFFDRAIPDAGFSRIVFDDSKGARLAIDRLVISGFTRIAHLAGYSTTNIGRERLDGYLSGLEKNGLITWKEWIIEGGYEVRDGYKSFLKLHKAGNLPEVVLTVNDRVALGVYKACRELGIRIPEDIGVIGFGFPETAELLNPPLAVITQDPRMMGKTATERLLAEIQHEGPIPVTEIRLDEDFQWNSSVKFKR
jgi:LacI family transcriptional regulator